VPISFRPMERMWRYVPRSIKATAPYVLARSLVARSEARRVAPSEECPHPEWWTSVDSDSTEREVTKLVAGFIRALQPQYVVETGTAFAQTTRAIGRALRKNGHGHLDSLEVDRARVVQARFWCTRLPVMVHDVSSLDFEPRQQIDFAWFDSLAELRVPEFRRFLPWMHSATVVGFHDTTVLAAEIGLSRLEDEGLLRTLYLPTPRGVAFGRPVK
jgi:predicted O-methyltransferase YrrM